MINGFMKNSIELRTGALNNYDTELVVVDIYQAPAPRTLINHKFSYNTLDKTRLNANAKVLHYMLYSVARSLVLKMFPEMHSCLRAAGLYGSHNLQDSVFHDLLEWIDVS